jgi:peptide/nickel transport system substrate-binding protein
MLRRSFLKLMSAVSAVAVTAVTAPDPVRAQSKPGTLRVAMTAADIPLTTGQPSQGAEGIRFLGITLYDGLTRWDLSKSDQAAGRSGPSSCAKASSSTTARSSTPTRWCSTSRS